MAISSPSPYIRIHSVVYRQSRYRGDGESRLPTLVKLAPYLTDFASDEQFHYGLDQIIAGLEKEIRHGKG